MLNFNTVTGNANRGGGQYQQQNQVSAPLERIRAIVSKKGIVGVAVPFQTPRANAVRQFIHARLLNRHNQKIFLWRAVMNNMWTNIALNSTPERPELTATPVECCIALMTALSIALEYVCRVIRGFLYLFLCLIRLHIRRSSIYDGPLGLRVDRPQGQSTRTASPKG